MSNVPGTVACGPAEWSHAPRLRNSSVVFDCSAKFDAKLAMESGRQPVLPADAMSHSSRYFAVGRERYRKSRTHICRQSRRPVKPLSGYGVVSKLSPLFYDCKGFEDKFR